MVSGWAALTHTPDSATDDREFEREPLAGREDSKASNDAASSPVKYHVLGSSLEHSSTEPVAVRSRKRVRNSRGASRLQRLLVPGSLGALCLSCFVLVGSMCARFNHRYRVFGWLAQELGYPNFAQLMTLLAFASFAAAITGGIGWLAASKPEESITFCLTPTAIAVSALTLPLAMVIEQGFARASTPLLSRAANEVCQSQIGLRVVWHCDREATGQEAPTTGLLGNVPPGPGDIFFNTTEEVALNSQDPVRAGAAAFVSLLEGEDARCELLATLCEPPTWFQEATSCACRSPSQLAGSAKGGFCAAWGPGTDPWCLVGPFVTCGHPAPHPQSGLKRSEGPCTDLVDSRSQLVYDGVWALHVSCLGASLLGLLLLLEALGALDYYRAGRDRIVKRALSSGPPRGMSVEDVEAMEPSEAEWDVLMRAGHGASEEDKLKIYAYYMQSKCGDAPHSASPGCGRLGLVKQEEWSKLRGMPRAEAQRLYNEAVGVDAEPNFGATVYKTDSGL